MRRQIGLLVAVISTAIVASFVIPLLLLVNTLAADRGMAVASQQANTVAMVVSSLHDDPRLVDALQSSLTGSVAATTVVPPDGHLVGAPWDQLSADPAFQQARQGQAFSVRDAAGGQVYVPVIVDGGVAVIRAAMTPAQLSDGVPLAWVSIIALVLSGVAVFVAAQVARNVSRPLLSVAQAAHRLREGDLSARATVSGPPETVELGSALNGLAERIEQLLAAERDAVRGLAHRLRTPVTALRLEAEQLTDPGLGADLTDQVDEVGQIRLLRPVVEAMSRRSAQLERNLARIEAEWRAEHPGVEPSARLARLWDVQAWEKERPYKAEAGVLDDELAVWAARIGEVLAEHRIRPPARPGTPTSSRRQPASPRRRPGVPHDLGPRARRRPGPASRRTDRAPSCPKLGPSDRHRQEGHHHDPGTGTGRDPGRARKPAPLLDQPDGPRPRDRRPPRPARHRPRTPATGGRRPAGMQQRARPARC